VAPEQETERQAVASQTQLLAFDRQNHMGASDSMAATIRAAIEEEAEAMLADKHTVSSAVNIRQNAEKIKARARPGWVSPSPV
jgi:nitric oxide synthase-interacting protein